MSRIGTVILVGAALYIGVQVFGHGTPTVATTSLSNPAIEADINAEFGSSASCATWIVSHESGGNVTATNPSSGAYGLGQALPPDKMAPYGADWRTNPVTQLRWMHDYVNQRYGGACPAQTFWVTHNWY